MVVLNRHCRVPKTHTRHVKAVLKFGKFAPQSSDALENRQPVTTKNNPCVHCARPVRSRGRTRWRRFRSRARRARRSACLCSCARAIAGRAARAPRPARSAPPRVVRSRSRRRSSPRWSSARSSRSRGATRPGSRPASAVMPSPARRWARASATPRRTRAGRVVFRRRRTLMRRVRSGITTTSPRPAAGLWCGTSATCPRLSCCGTKPPSTSRRRTRRCGTGSTRARRITGRSSSCRRR